MFCVDTEHAARMRQALVNENSDLCTQYPRSSAAARAFTRTRRSTTSRWWSHRRSRPPRSRRTPGDRAADRGAGGARRAAPLSRAGLLLPVRLLHARAAPVGARRVRTHRSCARRSQVSGPARNARRRRSHPHRGRAPRTASDSRQSPGRSRPGKAQDQARGRRDRRGPAAVAGRKTAREEAAGTLSVEAIDRRSSRACSAYPATAAGADITSGDRRAASRNTHHAGAAGTRGRQAPRKDRPQGGRTPGRAPARFPGPSIEALEDSAFLLTIAWSRDHVHVGVAKPTWSRPPCDNPNPRQLGATPPPHRGDDSRDGPAPSWRAADGLAVVVRCWCP